MGKIKYFLLLICVTVGAQNTWEGGLSYGNSDVFRNDQPSFYNYSNQEYGIFLQRNFSFANTENQVWKRYWNIESNLVISDFEYLRDNNNSAEFRINAMAGFTLKFPIRSFDFRVNAKAGPGFHTGYEHRMQKGIYFTEAISMQAGLNAQKKWNPFLRVGAMHVSNANLYDLNKGLEVLYIKIGWRLNGSPSHAID